MNNWPFCDIMTHKTYISELQNQDGFEAWPWGQMTKKETHSQSQNGDQPNGVIA